MQFDILLNSSECDDFNMYYLFLLIFFQNVSQFELEVFDLPPSILHTVALRCAFSTHFDISAEIVGFITT